MMTQRMEAHAAPIRVALVDDSPELRAALARLFERIADLKLVYAAPRVDDMLEHSPEVRPQVVVLDLSAAGAEPMREVMRLSRTVPGVRILVFSGHNDPVLIEETRKMGAAGYLGKDAEPQRLIEAIRRVASGHEDFPGFGGGMFIDSEPPKPRS